MNRNNKYCYFCKQQGHRQEECRRRIKEKKPCCDAQGRTYWPRIYFMEENQDAKSVNAINFPEDKILDDDEEHRFNIARVNFNNLCTVYIATCSKHFEHIMPFYWDKTKPRVSGKVASKNFSWVIDTGSAVTCMNINSFEMAFGKTLRINKKYKIYIFIKKRKCTHTMVIMDEFSKNILGVDFIQKHRLHYNQNTQQISFLQTLSKAIFGVKNFTLPPFAATMVQARSFQTISKDQNYVADICAPKAPLVSRPSSLVNFDQKNHRTIWLQNCAPHKTSIKKGTY
jgi:hypothetical protein